MNNNNYSLDDFVSAKTLMRKKIGEENFELIIAGHKPIKNREYTTD